jgi:inner membrane protein
VASISHLAAGALCGAVYAHRTSTRPLPAIARFAFLGLSPDLDFIGLELGSDGTFLEHRVMTHSFTFALVVGIAIGALGGRPAFKGLASALCVAALASHGLLDAMTANGPGPQLLWPFAATPIQLAWHPIPGTQFYQDYFTPAAIPVLSVEALLSLPLVAAAAWILLRRGGKPSAPNE